MNLDEREQGLLRLVENYRDAECHALITAAEAEARAMIGRAYGIARARLHERIVAERGEARARIDAVHAERDTRVRAGSERANARLLALAWPRLVQTLTARWQDATARAAWVAAVVAQARALLPVGCWSLHHPADWLAAESQALAASVANIQGQAPRLVADLSISAGLRIASGGAVLDGTIEGLLKDRVRIEARLLALQNTGAPS